MIKLIGDSNSKAYAMALKQDGTEGIDLAAALTQKFGVPEARMVLPGYAFFEKFYKFGENRVVFRNVSEPELGRYALTLDSDTIYGFSFGFHTAVMLRQNYWSNFTILPGPTEKTYISKGAFKKMVLDENKNTLLFVQELKNRGIKFFLVGAPPVRQGQIDRHAGACSAEEILLLRDQYLKIMAEAFDALGVTYILPPEEVMDGKLLKPEYESTGPNDVHHANRKYGVLMWRYIMDNLNMGTVAA
ncbi:MAG: hypothetical protein RLZZ444_4297 [Pseudomonadota bacterium]